MCDKLASSITGNQKVQKFNTAMSAIWTEMDLSQQAILEKKQRISGSLMGLIEDTIKKMESLEQEALRKYRVEKIRTEIKACWSKCHYSAEQQQEFKAFYSDDYTDDLLAAHQSELQSLQQYLDDNKKLFEVIEKYLELYERSALLEAQEKNPNRLFENRGGQLLKNERDLKAARRELPKYEKRIATMTGDFGQKYGRKFTINGKSFEETVKSRTEKLSENIEVMKTQNVEEMKERVAHGGSTMKRKLATEPKSTAKPESKLTAPKTFRRAL